MRLVIVGTGGFGREVMSYAMERGAHDLAFASDSGGEPVFGMPVIRLDDLQDDDQAVIAIASSETRRVVAQRLRCHVGSLHLGFVGEDVEIDEGAILCPQTTVTASARIGKHFHANIYSYVAHDCVIGDYVTFAPRVCCNGNVHIGDAAYIGTGAIIRQGTADRPLVIGAGATVGMGAVVTKDVPPGETVVGNPAKPMAKR
ncbi:MAG: NeuD/PglB/VioB family sugar acetyltransferase [Sandaracinaceae bacterium]|nr:NeuD/PglB/VioB family sugar acetyltransferase [Sandaracinaceae bacterium]